MRLTCIGLFCSHLVWALLVVLFIYIYIYIYIYIFPNFHSRVFFFFLVGGGCFYDFINQYGEKIEKRTGYWLLVFWSDRDPTDGKIGDVINNIINKILNYINKNKISLSLII